MPIGTVRALAGAWRGSPFHVVGVRDSKHVLKIVTTYGTLDKSGARLKIRRHPTSHQLVELRYPHVAQDYYRARHAVDDHNHLRQGTLSIENEVRAQGWHKRQFIALIAMSEVNAYCWHRFATKSAGAETGQYSSLLAFRRALALCLIKDPSASEVPAPPPPTPLPLHEHKLVKAPKNTGTWSREGGWKSVATTYLKHACAGLRCKKEVRTYCMCDPTKFWCAECFGKAHV